MCGIAGFFFVGESIKQKERNKDIFRIMTSLFEETQSRGTDAAGFSYINEHGNLITTKGPITAKKMVLEEKWKRLEDNMPESLIAHCRAMTTGSELDNFNNHPLVVNKKLALVHNGMISNHIELKTRFKLDTKGQVDSEVIPLLIKYYLGGKEDATPDEIAVAVNKTSVMLNGGFACAMLDRDTKDSLYLFNHSNPISLAYSKELETIFFASTKFIIEEAFDKVSLKEKVLDIFSFKTLHPSIIDIGNNTITVLSKDKNKKNNPKCNIESYEMLDTKYDSEQKCWVPDGDIETLKIKTITSGSSVKTYNSQSCYTAAGKYGGAYHGQGGLYD